MRDEGSAVVDFVLVCLILVPLFAAILQLGLDLYVRNTLAACAQDAARYAASEDIDTAGDDAIQRAAQQRADGCVNGPLPAGFVGQVTGVASAMAADRALPATVPVVEVSITSSLPAIGFLGRVPGHVVVRGHAMQELP